MFVVVEEGKLNKMFEEVLIKLELYSMRRRKHPQNPSDQDELTLTHSEVHYAICKLQDELKRSP